MLSLSGKRRRRRRERRERRKGRRWRKGRRKVDEGGGGMGRTEAHSFMFFG